MKDLVHVCVFCGSSDGEARHLALAQELGGLLAEARLTLVYGGGKRGMMGALAGAALAAGGKVVGIIPQALKERELAHSGLTMLHVVPDLARRKDMMCFMAEAFIALPGGLGTLDEVAQVLALRQLGLLPKPILLINQGGFFDPLLAQLKAMKASGFLHGGDAALPLLASGPAEALEILNKP